MGVNPHQQGPTPPKIKPFTIDLFVDVYKAYEEEFGKDFMAKHVGMAAIYLNAEKQGKLECCGTLQNMQYLVCLLMMRLATVQSRAIWEQTKGKRSPSVKECAKNIIENVWKQLEKLESFEHSFPAEKGNNVVRAK